MLGLSQGINVNTASREFINKYVNVAIPDVHTYYLKATVISTNILSKDTSDVSEGT